MFNLSDEPYHHIWCNKHGKTRKWLQHAFRNGFDIHHMDGDKTNSDPDNLVLIYSGDHMHIHNIKAFHGRVNGKWRTPEEAHKERMRLGKIAYDARYWGAPYAKCGVPSANYNAKYYALKKGLPFPLPRKGFKFTRGDHWNLKNHRATTEHKQKALQMLRMRIAMLPWSEIATRTGRTKKACMRTVEHYLAHHSNGCKVAALYKKHHSRQKG